jgi:hypothetical protein
VRADRGKALLPILATERKPLQGGVSDELRSQSLSFSLLTQVGRRPATSVQVVSVCWREQNAAPIEKSSPPQKQ